MKLKFYPVDFPDPFTKEWLKYYKYLMRRICEDTRIPQKFLIGSTRSYNEATARASLRRYNAKR